MPITIEQRMLEIKLLLNSIAAQRREYDSVEAGLVAEYNSLAKTLATARKDEQKRIAEAQANAQPKANAKPQGKSNSKKQP